MITLLDGPVGTELEVRGYKNDSIFWSAKAAIDAPDLVSGIHADYAKAGATIHTANTFRTTKRAVGQSWQELTKQAVGLARESVPSHHRVAGSIAPLEDCYRPDLSPDNPAEEHRMMAEELVSHGCDLLLCETFPHVGESIAATRQCVATGVETWLALTAGPESNLLTCAEIARAARHAVDSGVMAVLINCTAAEDTLRFVLALADANLGVPIGAYANAGYDQDLVGWSQQTLESAERYLAFARQWIDAGAKIVGGCCGTSPTHIAAIAQKYS